MSFNSGIIVIVLALLVVLQSGRWHTTEQHTKYVTWRLKRLEQKIDLMLNQMEIEYEDKTLEVVKELIKSDKKVAAIKMFRQQTGVDLAEAKRAIEAIAREMR